MGGQRGQEADCGRAGLLVRYLLMPLLLTPALSGAVVAPGKPTLYASSSVYPPEDQSKASKTFTTKACAYGGFILLLYFSLAAVWCMCNMPMKQDTLLFGAQKRE
jgi:hypothetical protein